MSVNESRLISLFETLLAELGNANIETEAQAFARDRMVARMRKRACLGDKTLKSKAIAKFKAINEEVGGVRINLDPDVENNAKYFIRVVLERYTSTLDPKLIQTCLSYPHLVDFWRFGPGASNGIPGTHTVDKIVQKMSTTALAKPLVVSLRHNHPYFSSYDAKGKGGTVEVRGSRLDTVPKNEENERTIAIEPSGNMALQLAAGIYLENTLRHIGLDIRTQEPKNQWLACLGSTTDALCTIDLSSASDRISRELVRRLMPLDWAILLERLRSPEIQIGEEWHKLNMISTMGNGFTFPLMTLIIVALIYGYRASLDSSERNILWVNWEYTAVYGDDIIVLRSEYSGLCKVLSDAGLVVNHDKSYSSGPFRESCGGDYYNGIDVTPAYVKSLTTDPEIFVAINQLAEWGARHRIHIFKSLVLLLGFLRGKAHVVPEWHGSDEGIRTAWAPKRRYTYLRIKANWKEVPQEAGHFIMPLAIGGYIFRMHKGAITGLPKGRTEELPRKRREPLHKGQGEGITLCYTPRLRANERPRYRVKEARLPEGFLDGADPKSRTADVTSRLNIW